MSTLPTTEDLEQALELAFKTPVRIIGNHEITIKGDAVKLIIQAKLTAHSGVNGSEPEFKAAPEDNTKGNANGSYDETYDPLRGRKSNREQIIIDILVEALPNPLSLSELRKRNRARNGDNNNYMHVLRRLRDKGIIDVPHDGFVYFKHNSEPVTED